MSKRMAGFASMLVLVCVVSLIVSPQGKSEPAPTLSEAMARAKDGKNAEAIEVIREIIRRSPDGGSASAHVHLGFLYFKTEQYDNALEEFNAALAADRSSAMSYYFTAMIYEAKAVKADKPAKKEFERKALDAWQEYLASAGKAKPKPAGHGSIAVEEGMQRAAKHIELLKEGLSHE